MEIIKTIDINPFVRHAMHNRLIPSKHTVVSRDCRLFYIKEGGGSVTINGDMHPLLSDMILLFQGGNQYLFNKETPIPLISINFDFKNDNFEQQTPFPVIEVENYTAENQICPIIFDDFSFLNTPIIIESASFVLPTIERLIKEKNSANPYRDLYVSALMKECITKILRFIDTSNKKAFTNEKVKDILKYIEENYTLNIGNADIAKIANYHPYYLNKLILEATGKTLHQYIISLRLTAAERLLITENLNVAEIAEAVGFSSSMVFIANFKKKNNMTPCDFRKEMRTLM